MSTDATVEAPPELTEKEKIIAEYELPDSNFDPDVDAEPAPAEVKPAAATPAETPRGPDGKFIKAAPVVPERLKKLALDLGITEAEVAASSAEDLRDLAHVAALERIARREDYSKAQVPVAVPVAEPVVEAKPTAGVDVIKALVDEGQTHEPIIAAFKAQAEQIKALEATVKQLLARDNVRLQETANQTYDRKFSERADVFGDKPYASLDKASPQMHRREAVSLLVKKMKGGSLEANIEKAIETLYPGEKKDSKAGVQNGTPDKNGKPANGKPLTEDEEDWLQAGLSRPSHRNGMPEPKGVKPAEKKVAQMLRDFNEPLDVETGVEEAGLPE